MSVSTKVPRVEPDDPQPGTGARLSDPGTTVRLGLADAGRCRRRVHLDHDPGADRSAMRAPDPGLQLRRDTLALHRADVQAALSAGTEMAAGLPAGGTVRPAVIWGARLTSAERFAAIDLLLREPDGGYLPVLVRGHRTTDPGHGALVTTLGDLTAWSETVRANPAAAQPVSRNVASGKKLRSHHQDSLALAHAYRVLADLGLASGETWGGIIGFGSSSTDPDWEDGGVIVWHRLDAPAGPAGTALDDYDARFADRLAVARAAATRGQALAAPSRIGECRRCPWWTVCGPELEAAHDVSLLVAGGDVDVLRAAGADTYDDVAHMDKAMLTALPLTGIPAAEARIRARAMASGAPMVRRTETLDVARADVELDIDMESYLDEGAYLWGTYLTGVPIDGFEQCYRPFVTWRPLDSGDTAANFAAFWRYLQELRGVAAARDLTFAAYCYSHKAEERWLYGTPLRFPAEPGMPGHAEVAAFCGSNQWVDLYQEVKRLFVVPGSLRLKAVAPVAGFTWRDPEPGGENSMAWYRTATSSGGVDPADVASNRQRILDYNEDDCRATWALRHWMSERPTAMPTVAEIAARYGALPSGDEQPHA